MWRGFCCLRFCCRVFLQSVLLVFSVWAFVCCVLLPYASVVCRFMLFECLVLLLFFSAGLYALVLLSCGGWLLCVWFFSYVVS